MRKKQKNQRYNVNRKAAAKRPAVRVLNALIVIAAIILAFIAVKMINHLSYTRTTFFNDEYMGYDIENEQFGSLVSSYFSYHADQPEYEEEAGESGKVAQYANAAFLYKAFRQYGLDDYAGYQKSLMEDALEGIVDYAPAADKINDRLGLEQ